MATTRRITSATRASTRAGSRTQRRLAAEEVVRNIHGGGEGVDLVVNAVLDGALLLVGVSARLVGQGQACGLGPGLVFLVARFLTCWKAALSSSRFSPPAAASSASTRALKPPLASDMSSVRTSCHEE